MGSTIARRVLYFDILSILACLAVIFMHCNGVVHSFSPSSAWYEALLVEVLAYWAVPVFFMLTGAKTLGYEDRYSTGTFFKKRFFGVFLPFIIWSVILYVIRFSGSFGIARPEGWNFSIGSFYRAFMECKIEPTYWFFYAMLSITLAVPIISKLRNNTKVLVYLCTSSFIATGVFPVFAELFGLPWNADLTMPAAGGYVPYVVLGYLLHNTDYFRIRSRRIVLYSLALICLVFRYVYTLLSSEALGELDRTLFSYQSFVATLPSMAIFVMFKQIFLNNHLLSRKEFTNSFISVLSVLSNSCFGIYLIHKLILDNIICGIFGIEMNSLFMRWCCPWIVYSASLMFVLIIKRMPLLRRIMP